MSHKKIVTQSDGSNALKWLCDTRYGSSYMTRKGWNRILMYSHGKPHNLGCENTSYVSFYMTGKEWDRFICDNVKHV